MVFDPEDGDLHHDRSDDLSGDLQDEPCPCNERRKDERDDGSRGGCLRDDPGGVSVHQVHRETEVSDVSDRMDHPDVTPANHGHTDLVNRFEHHPACD